MKEIKVTNGVSINTTIHWHGIKQLRTGWADGPAYFTQCPIRPGQSYTYKFTVSGQRGTLWWHAHIAWQRATIYGAIIVYPRMPYKLSFTCNFQFIFSNAIDGDGGLQVWVVLKLGFLEKGIMWKQKHNNKK
ncbi:unnamed protein product [Lactuca virosa]|uniref:Plastocyanin-like domain-containing protein n=1 Tax=Lactuca virosa TaxID=75947 RepID=A0AAU9LU10_9ASTR|nr:unnamed protein product [Lactuca virosa]